MTSPTPVPASMLYLSWRRLALMAMIVLALGVVVATAHRVALSRNIERLHAHSVNRLDLIGTAIEATLARFRYLPEVIARSREVEALFAYGEGADTINSANAMLERIANASRASALYVIGRDGTTIAASNYRDVTSFVGQNYAFRSYFKDALQHRRGSMYAIGATTGLPGYFLSTAITIGTEVVGVAVVKIDLTPLELEWSSVREDVGIRDDDGIIFLAADARWRYRSVTGLTPADLARIDAGKRYTSMQLVSDPLFELATPMARDGKVHSALVTSVGGETLPGLLMERRFSENDWSLIYLASLADADRNASLVGLAAGLSGLLLVAVAQIWRQRRKVRRMERESLIRLERRVADRTKALTEANARLTTEIAERSRTERELETARNDLLQATKLATIGQAFASMAHEVNQPLAALRAYLASSQLLSERGDREGLASNIVLMRDVIDRLASLTGRLKALARRNHGDRKWVDLNACIERVADLMTFRIRDLGITLEIRGREQMMVMADAGRLDQVALNLMTNAIDAVASRPARIIRVETRRDEGWAILTMEDSGSGVAPEVLARLYEPFVTTKDETGLGLGLATVKTIVSDYDGTIACGASSLGGACFTIRLPAQDARAANRKALHEA